MYSFANRGGIKVYDEPFFGCFLKETGAWRPSRMEVLEQMELDFNKVLLQIQEANRQQRVFLKNMGNHLQGVSLDVLSVFRNVVLVRKPAAVIASYTQQVEAPTALDLCYDHQLQVLQYLKRAGLPYYLVDSDDIKKQPRETLSALCNYLQVPFTERMLQWKAGARKEDGVWAKYWYHNVHQSTGFRGFEEKDYHVPAHLQELHAHCEARYQEIKNF